MSRDRRVNLLALPKRKDLWECFIAPNGYLVASDDVTALEPHVMTQLTQDSNLLKIYGNNSEPHCVYLFSAAFFPRHQEKVRSLYNLEGNGSEVNLEAIKGQLKFERKDSKPVFLGWCYGLGAQTLAFDKQISFQEAKDMLRAVDKAFPGKQRLHNFLIKEWKNNNGWVMNARGMPVTVPKEKTKDIVNRVIQGSGVQLHYRMLYHRWNYIRDNNIDVKPYIPHLHDEANMLVGINDQDRYIEAVEYSYDRLNDELGWSVTIKHGGVSFGKDMSIRCD